MRADQQCAAIGFATESRAGRTIRTLGAPAPLSARAVRAGLSSDIPAEMLVPGTVVVKEIVAGIRAVGLMYGRSERHCVRRCGTNRAGAQKFGLNI